MTNSQKTKKKLLKTGTYTYIVTLPKDWVQKLNWRSKQMLELELSGKEIILRDYPNV